jgi:hypothetical protein
MPGVILRPAIAHAQRKDAVRQWKRAVKFGLLIIVLIVCIGGSGCAAKYDAQPPLTVAELAAIHAESGLDVSAEQIKAELLRMEKSWEASRVKEEKRKATKALLLSCATAGFLWLFAKYLRVGSRKRWHGLAADVLLASFGLLVAAYLVVNIHYDMVLGRTGMNSRSGFSVASSESEPLLFHATLLLKAAIVGFIAYLSLRKFFRKK